MVRRFGLAVVGAAVACAAAIAQGQSSDPTGTLDSIASVSSVPAVTSEQRARLARKLQLIDQIVRAADPDMQANNVGADQKRWLLESLYSAPLDQIQKLGVPGSFAATAAALSRTAATPKLLGDRQFDLVYRPLTPCRYIDTRNVGGRIIGSRGFDLANSGVTYGGSASCNPKASAPFSSESFIGAIAINLTVVSPANSPGFMGVRPAGSTNTTSMVNWYEDGPNVQAANAGVVITNQFGSPNDIEFFGSPAQIIVDVHGIFTAPEQGFVPQVHEIGIGQAAGASADVFLTLPFDTPVSVTGTTLTPGVRGVGQVTILRCCGGTDAFLEWVGLDSTAGAAITQGFSGTPGTKIVFIDFDHQVVLEVGAAGSIRMHNTSSGARSTVLKLIY